MKKVLVLPLLLIFLMFSLFSSISANTEIIINQQPREIYNLGDFVSIPTTIKTISNFPGGSLNADLLCGSREENFHKSIIKPLSAGEEERINVNLVLTRNIIGELKGTCRIKMHLEENYVLTDNFRISDLINVNAELVASEFNPGENILIEGSATKENGRAVNGFIESKIVKGDTLIISHLETVNNGFFSINITLSKEIKAGDLILILDVYEIDSLKEKTNKGSLNQGIVINQVPTSLEIIFDEKEVEPGTDLRVKAVLRDQSGEKIESVSTIIIKNQNDRIIERIQVATDEFLNFNIKYNEAPSVWNVVAISEEIERGASFTILKKESINIEIINKTLTITNTGNVPYNKTALIKVGNETLNIDVYLDVDKNQKYVLTAPDGKYTVEVITEDANITAEVSLTGKVIDIKEASSRMGSLMRYPLAWIFIILLLGFIAFAIFKKGYRKTFIGYISSKIKRKKKKEDSKATTKSPLSKSSLIKSGNKAELSLSIKGSKQEASVVTLHIKNLNEIQSKKSNAEETLQKIVDFAESHKASTYESHNNLFFILAPIKTKTFKNEKTALDISKKAVEILKNHNKMFKQKIHFGISLNQGEIIAKQEKASIEFMSLGTLMAVSKKIASLSEEEILLSEKINDKLRSHLKTIKQEKGNLNIYSIKEIKNTEDHKKFIKGFLNRIEDK